MNHPFNFTIAERSNMYPQSRKTNFSVIAYAVSAIILLSGLSTAQAAPPWEQIHKLFASDGAVSDQFGFSVAVSGNIGVIGAILGEGNVALSGSAYVFDVTTGQQLFKLLPSVGATGDEFGFSAAVSGNTAVIGALGDDDKGSYSGSAYVFDVTTGQQLFKLLPSDGARNDQFGISVAVSGNLAVIGALGDNDNGSNSGSAYVFDITTGQQLFKLLPSDGAAGDFFGISVAASGNIAVIGADSDDDNGDRSGSAYVFDITTGQQLFKLLPSDGVAVGFFGSSVAIDGNTAVIGAKFDTDNGSNSGSAYVFDVSTGQQLFKLLATDGAQGDQFGKSVAVSGNTAVIGAWRDGDNGAGSGSAYAFDVTTGGQLFKLLPPDGGLYDRFGFSVALSANIAVIGAKDDDDNGGDSGAAYVFQQMTSYCLDLTVDNLIAGQNATFTITGGTSGTRAVTVYGTKAGQTIVNNISGYCATFGIKGVTQSKVLGGLNQTFDNNGQISFNQPIPPNTNGTQVFFQSAMQGTCPDECTSNLLIMTVQ